MVDQSPEQRLLDAIVFKAYNDICDFIGLPLEHRFKLGTGEFIIDFYKQMETTARLAKGARMANNANQSPEMHAPDSQLPAVTQFVQARLEQPAIQEEQTNGSI